MKITYKKGYLRNQCYFIILWNVLTYYLWYLNTLPLYVLMIYSSILMLICIVFVYSLTKRVYIQLTDQHLIRYGLFTSKKINLSNLQKVSRKIDCLQVEDNFRIIKIKRKFVNQKDLKALEIKLKTRLHLEN